MVGYEMPKFSLMFINLEPDTVTDSMIRLASDTDALTKTKIGLNHISIV